MKLKEKFLELTNSECEHDSYCKDNDCKYDGQVVCRLNIRKSERCEVIADEFAIGFAEWFIDSEGKPKGEWSIKELLEMYKKEKRL